MASTSTPASPATSLQSQEVLPHGTAHHPTYERLLLRLFRSSGLSGTVIPESKALHLTSIRAMFLKQYVDKYWFPPSWPRHLYQRLRDMERAGHVVSSGPHSLYFRPAPGTVSKTNKRLRKRTKQRAAKQQSYKEQKSPKVLTKTKNTAHNAPEPVSDSIEAVNACLKAFEPWEEVARLEGRMASHLQILQRVLNALQSGSSEELHAIQDQLDELLEAPSESVDNVAALEELGQLAEKMSAEFANHEHDALAEPIRNLIDHLSCTNTLKSIDLTSTITTISTLIASLLTSLHLLQGDLEQQQDRESHYRSVIEALEQELSKSRSLSQLDHEETEKEMATIHHAENSFKKAVALLEEKLILHQKLLAEEGAQYQSMLEALHNDSGIRFHSEQDYQEKIKALERELNDLMMLSSDQEIKMQTMASTLSEYELHLKQNEENQEKLKGSLGKMVQVIEAVENQFKNIPAQMRTAI